MTRDPAGVDGRTDLAVDVEVSFVLSSRMFRFARA